tara:strand:+ start:451 stop:651 length:201 start_codon:yes stop_codon:yes gene_type:complete
MKKKKTYSKHDLRRRIEDIDMTLYFIADRLKKLEVVFNDFVEMTKQSKKLEKYLDGKYKQPEREQG